MNEWLQIQQSDEYTPSTLKDSSFIHFSKADQILNVANSLYKNTDENLVILRVDTDKLKAELKFEIPVEAPYSTVTYPHLYGPLNLDAVEAAISISKDDQGEFVLPKLF